ncbi:MAG: PKD domain-containing protein, partial [Bacteroidota bacterium]|nr:PKD domain-containing protein [Bacteroidota bacterium]
GVNFDWSETTPSCTRQHVWMNFDSLLDRLDATPTILDKWTPQAGFLLDPVTPWPLGTLSMPQYPNEIYYDYTGKLADSCGRITVGLRVQNGFDPHTKQPCIDEKLYHNMLNYINSDPEFTLYTVYGCSPLEVELEFIREYHDSLDALMINANVDFTLDNDYNKGFTYIDSVYRNKYDPRTGTFINYVLTFYIDRTGIPKKVDSMVWSPGEGGLIGCGSELKIKTKRKLTFREPGRYAIVTTSRTKDGCDNTSSVHYVVVGHAKNIGQNKTLICRDEVVEFIDTSLYLLLEPDPLTGEQFIRYNYWRNTNRFQHPDGSSRTPTPFQERTRWNFGQGTGFTPISFNPIPVSYRVPGHYIVEAEFRDSVGCLDTMRLEVDVTGGKANFNFTINIGNCKPIINFFDSSICYDPCRLMYGFGCDSVIRWIWDFGDGSAIVNTTIDNPVAPPIINPSHVYQRFGDYEVKLIIETRMGCWDTLTRTVSVAGPQPRFDFTIDSIGCAPYTVYLGNFSIDPSPTSRWTWHFGDGNSITTASDTVIYYTYNTPGKYKLLLEQEDLVPLTGERCRDSFPAFPKNIEVTVLPAKPVDFIPSKIEVCPNEIITFNDTSDTTYTTFIWDFGDGTVITLDKSAGGRQVTHKYNAVGTYIVRLTPDYTPAPGEPKCRQSKSIKIIVRDVNASFAVDTTGMPLFKFTNMSTNAIRYWWRFGDGGDWMPCPEVDPVNCPNAWHNY